MLKNTLYAVKIILGDILFILIEFFIYNFFLFFKLYSLLENKFMFISSGSKLDKYIENSNLKSITCNFNNAQNNPNKFYLNFLSPIWYKQIFVCLLVSISIVSIKVAITYRFFVSNFFSIKFFRKYLNISVILGKHFLLFKIMYYLSFLIFVYYITFKIIIKLKVNTYNNNFIENYKESIPIGINNKGNNVLIDKSGLYQNILVTGSIGSGKTSSAISNILDGLLNLGITGLIIDIKGNYINIARKICVKYNKRLVELTMQNDIKFNPFIGLDSIQVANMIKRVLELTSDTTKSDSYWIDKMESVIRDLVTILIYNNKKISFYEIHNIVLDNDYLVENISNIKEKILSGEFDDVQLFEINSAIMNIRGEYQKLDNRTYSIIKSEITRITGLFISDKKIYDKFCDITNINSFYDNVYILSIGIGENRLFAKLISTYIKLRFQMEVLKNSNVNSSIFFLCDEFQEIANRQDAEFLSLSREYKCINVLSMQSYSSLKNSMNDQSSANVILQSLVNKIWFRNDDIYTVSQVIKQIGKIKKEHQTMNLSENSQNDSYSIFSNKFKTLKSGLSKGYSISSKDEYRLSEEYFTQKLKTFEAVCLTTNGTDVKIDEKVSLKRWEEINE